MKLVINCAQSVIERRDAATAVEHALLAREHKVLGGVVLSGCAAVESASVSRGRTRMCRRRGVQPAWWTGQPSLMAEQRMTDVLRTAGADAAVGLKLSVRRRDAAMATWVDFVATAIDALRRGHRAAWPTET